jgi:hypothetical protein
MSYGIYFFYAFILLLLVYLLRLVKPIDKGIIKTPISKCCLYWCLLEFIYWRHMLVFSTPVVKLLPLYLLSDLLHASPPPEVNIQYMQTVCGCGGAC